MAVYPANNDFQYATLISQGYTPKVNWDGSITWLPPGSGAPTTPASTPTPEVPPALTGVDPSDVASATYGKVIPIVVGGAPRVGGYIIYGPKYRTDAGIVYCSFGISFGLQANPDGARELWELRFDGVKVYTPEDGNLISGLTFRFVEGTETQLPDAMLVTAYGAAAPAFRSQCVVYIQDLPLTNFGNHVPFVSAVLADVTDGADPTDGVPLGDALELLAATPYVGLDSTQFETTGITTRIDAIIDAERSSFMGLLQRLARLFPLDVVQTDKLRVIERSSIAPDIVLTPNRILAGPDAVSIGRAQEASVAAELEFVYIDIDRDYELTPQRARRPIDPIALTASRSKETINLPLVMTANEAISAVTLRKYWDEVSRESISFTALPYGMEIEPGDMVAIKLPLKTYVVRIEETLHEARGTVRCTGTPVLRCSLSSIDDGPEIGDTGELTHGFVIGGYVAGRHPVLQTSQAGSAWTQRVSDPLTDGYWIDSADFGGILFLVVGADDAALVPHMSSSADGVNWSPVPLPSMGGYLYAASGDGPLAVSVGTDDLGEPIIITSPDGASWTRRSNPFTGSLLGATYGSGVYVVCGLIGSDPSVATSPDGVAWTSRTPSPATNAAYEYVSTNGSLFVAVGVFGSAALTATSPDGVTWTQRTNPAPVVSNLVSVRYAAGYFVAVGDSAGGAALIMTSPDGITWTQQTLPGSPSVFNDVNYSEGTWVVCGDGIYTSADLVTWVARTSAIPGGTLYTAVGR